MTDKKIVALLKKGERESAIRSLYALYPKIKKAVLSNNGSESEAREIFHDSLVLLIEKIQKPDFQLTAKLSTFLYSINHFMWMNELRKRQKTPEIAWKEELQYTAAEIEYDMEKEALYEKMNVVLDSIGEKCKKIIRLFYFEKKKMDQIAKTLNFSSVNSAKTQKYKCMEKAIKLGKTLKTEIKMSL